jgi:transcriptional regulator with XRE-family HTH domain
VGVRVNPIDEADRVARRQLADLIRELRAQRILGGHAQRTVADAIGCSRQLLADWERGVIVPGLLPLVRWGAAVGLELQMRAFLVGSTLRDRGQLRLLDRGRAALRNWTWRTEVPASPDPADRRAIDAVLSGPDGTIGIEAITRFADAQAHVRAAVLKQQSAHLDRFILLLTDSRHNRQAIRDAEPTLRPAFPLSGRQLLAALRSARMPPANGVLLL